MSSPPKNPFPAPAYRAVSRPAISPPPVYRPQAPLVQAKQAVPAPPVFRPSRPVGPAPVLQARQAAGDRPALPVAPRVIQRAKLTPDQAADKAMMELIAEEDAKEKKKKKSLKPSATSQKKKSAPKPSVNLEAEKKKAEQEAAFARREQERAQEAEEELKKFAENWRGFEQGLDNVASLFGLLANRHATLDQPHRCFLSNYEKQGNVRHQNKFGLSMGIRISQQLETKYQAMFHVATTDRVVHFHCLGNGSVASFGVKPRASERLPGQNTIIPDMYKSRANALVDGFDGNNVEALVGAFD